MQEAQVAREIRQVVAKRLTSVACGGEFIDSPLFGPVLDRLHYSRDILLFCIHPNSEVIDFE